MQTPYITLNGTSPKELLNQQMVAMDARMLAIKALRLAGPNARDCQTAPPDAFSKAQNEHSARLKHLDIVMRKLDQIAQDIANRV